MKITILVSFLLSFAGTCMADYSPNYSAYSSWSIDDSGNLTQSVIIDGTTDGDCWMNGGTYWIPGCPAQHSVQMTNSLNGVSSGRGGPSQDMFSYISYEDDVTIPTDSETQFDSVTDAQIYCFVGLAVIFDSGFLNPPKTPPSNLLASSCTSNSSFAVRLAASWGILGGCTQNDTTPIASNPPATCITRSDGIQCYSIPEQGKPNCAYNYCPGRYRRVGGPPSCPFANRKFPIESAEVCTSYP